MKYCLLVTQDCNLRCSYCYIGKRAAVMSLDTGKKAINLAFERTPFDEEVDIAFFGGEPLLVFPLIRQLTDEIHSHPSYYPGRLQLTIVSNGTIFNDQIAEFIQDNHIAFGVSCDGPPQVQDRFRRFENGMRSSRQVERTMRRALESVPDLMVNAVYRPETFEQLPEVIDYFSDLGIRQIYLSPDFSAPWTAEHASNLYGVYSDIGCRYIDYYEAGNPHFISLIDSKIAVLLRGGYQPDERCRLGEGQLAFSPEGRIYPCERLVGDGGTQHCIGDLDSGVHVEKMRCHYIGDTDTTTRCNECSLTDYCMHWCGCTNYFGSGYYDVAAPFLCASEQASIRCAMEVFRELERTFGDTFYEHLGGIPIVNSIKHAVATSHGRFTTT